MAELRFSLAIWQRSLHVGEVYGCRPGTEFLDWLSVVEEREGPVPLSSWYAYLWPWFRHVTDEYAACLGDALGRAVVELRDPAFDLHHRLNDSNAATLTRGAVSNEEVEGFAVLRDWCAQGGFEVGLVFPFPKDALLSRAD